MHVQIKYCVLREVFLKQSEAIFRTGVLRNRCYRIQAKLNQVRLKLNPGLNVIE